MLTGVRHARLLLPAEALIKSWCVVMIPITAVAGLLLQSLEAQSPTTMPAPAQVVASPAVPFRSAVSIGNGDGITTLKTSVRRVVVDVVVTDEKNHPVKDLTAKDFSVTEDNAPQAIRNFEMHTIGSQPEYVPPKVPNLPPNTFLNLASAPQTGTPTVLLYDVLNTPLDAQAYAHQEMVKFLKHRRPGVQVAVFILGDKLRLLQGFTDDANQLAQAIEQKKGRPSSSLYLGPTDRANNTTSSIADTAGNDNAAEDPSSNPQFTAIMGMLTQMEKLDQSDLLDRRVEITLDALTEIGRFLSGLPGRKNLVWLSASFPAGILPNANGSGTAIDHDQSRRNFGAAMKQATDLLNLGHVAVYPVDVRGVQVGSSYSASSRQTFAPYSSQDLHAAQSFAVSLASEHSTMETIADSTGGRAFYSTNDLQQAVGDAMENGSTYYSLTYAPTNPNFDGSLRRIRVKLQQPNYTLSYRKSYFADDLHKAAQAIEDAPQSPLTPSLERGTPLSHQLFIEAHLAALGPPAAATPEQMQVLSQYEAMQSKKKSKGPPKPLPPMMMQRYVIEYGLISRQLEMPAETTGAHKSSLEFGVISFDEDGKKLNGIDTKIEDTIPPPRFAHLQSDGYHVVQAITIPVTAASLRLAVRDALADRVGSLEVRLPLASVQPALVDMP